MLVLGVLETVMVHGITRMEVAKLTDAALAADSVMRVSLPTYYLFAVTWLVVWGSTRGSNPHMLTILGLFFFVVAVVPTVVMMRRQYRAHASLRLNALKALADDPTSDEKLRLVFDVFDKDGSGTLSLKELRHLLKAVLPSETRKRRKEFMEQIRQNSAGAKDCLKFEEVSQHVAEWSDIGGFANAHRFINAELGDFGDELGGAMEELGGAIKCAKDKVVKFTPGAADRKISMRLASKRMPIILQRLRRQRAASHAVETRELPESSAA
eukprot:7382914-Prymnesium_polylepis.1